MSIRKGVKTGDFDLAAPHPDQLLADGAEALSRGLRAGLASPTPRALLGFASMMLAVSAAPGVDPASTGAIVRGLAQRGRPEASAGALALATLAGDESLAPHHVTRLLDPTLRCIDPDDLDAYRTPELLRDLIRFGHAERGVPQELTDRSLREVDRRAPAFLHATRAWAEAS